MIGCSPPGEPAAAADATVSGRRTFVINDCAAPTIDLRFTADSAPAALRTRDVVSKSGGRAVDWTVQWSRPVATDPAIREFGAKGTVSPAACPRPGEYEVPVALVPAAGDAAIRTITITLSIPGPAIEAPATASWTIERWDPTAGPGMLTIPLRETSATLPARDLSVAAGALRTQGGEPTAILLRADPVPTTIPAGGVTLVTLRLSQPPPVGTYTTKVTLTAPLLLQERTVDVTLKVRAWPAYLLATLLVGVLLGWVVNVLLKRQSALWAAQLAGLELAGAIAARATTQRDPAVQQRLTALASTTERRLLAAADEAAAKSVADKAKEAAEAIEKMAATNTMRLDERLARARLAVRPTGRFDPTIETVLAEMLRPFETIERLARDGHAEEALRRLTDHDERLAASIDRALRPWLADLRGRLRSLGEWPEPGSEPEATRQLLLKDVAAAYQNPDPAKTLLEADRIAHVLRGWIDFAGVEAMRSAFEATADALEQGGRPDLAAPVRREKERLPVGAGANLGDALVLLAGIRDRIEQLLADGASGAPAVIALLRAGKFEEAAKLIAPPRPQPAGFTGRRPPSASPPVPTRLVAPPAVPTYRLLLPPVLTVDATTRAVLEADQPPPTAPTWSCEPADAADITDSSTIGANVTARKAGFLTVSAQVGATAVSWTGLVGDVAEAEPFRIVRQTSDRADLAVWVAAAVVTTAVGYQIFSTSWIGTFGDFLSVFLWGFLGQFGLARIREIAKPLLIKPLS